MSEHFTHWLWIVLDGHRPVAFVGDNQQWSNLFCRHFAQGFSTYADAYRARQELRGRYWKIANAAPSVDHSQFITFNQRAEEVVIVRVGVA